MSEALLESVAAVTKPWGLPERQRERLLALASNDWFAGHYISIAMQLSGSGPV